MALALDGPRLPPAAGGAAKQLVVFLHGYGADGNDLIGLGREWARILPHAAFVSPHAPEPCAMSPMGRQWFNLTFRDAGELVRGVKHAAPALDAFLDAELKRLGLSPRALALVGFSQGTMMALGVGLTRNPPPAAIVGYSGALAALEALPGGPGVGPAILLVHGDMDQVIPVDAMFLAREQLAKAGLPVEWHVAEGIGHGIDGEGLRLGGAFLRQAFASAGH
ncbi:phospholipase [Methyloceanibacter sp.]|uniref:alpha/beta hydrolase n=1 Tax=Methyloceanibacter sp. TaxID=1965321 RepID=UPI002D455654|nr:phospholipase [Methyloceanibacter sp.]HZP10383.1 phospholipase [Methyloceanibacter sp.]